MSEILLSGRLHPISPLRKSWLFISSLAWFAWSLRESIEKLHEKVGYTWMALIAVAFALVAIVAPSVGSWLKTSFCLTRTHLDFQYGLLHQIHRRFAVDQIRAVDVGRPLWARPFGVATLTISTQSEKQQISYLSLANAEEIKSTVTQIVHGEMPDTSDKGVIARVDARMLALSMLLDARLMLRLTVGGAAAAIPYLATDITWSLAFFLPWLRSAWTATGKRFPAEHGWTIREVESGFQTEFGLFNKDQHTWQKGRTASLTFHQPILWRRRDWVQVTAANVGFTSAKLLPVATRAEAEKVAVAIFGIDVLKALDNPQGISRSARWCTPFWRACAYSQPEGFIAGWKGLFLKQKVTVTRTERMIATSVEQGWWQRRHQVASVVVDLPGGPDLEIVHRDVEEATRIAETLRAQVVETARNGSRIRRIRLPEAGKRVPAARETPTETFSAPGVTASAGQSETPA